MRSAFLEDGHPMAGAAELLGGGESGQVRSRRPRCALAGADSRRFGLDPPLLDGTVGEGALNGLDGDRWLVDAEHAGGFTRGGADASGEFGEVVGGVKVTRGRFLPTAFEHQVVEVRDDVGQRTTGMAEGDAAVHAASTLGFGLVLGKWGYRFRTSR